MYNVTGGVCKEAITSKIKHAIKLKTSPARLEQLLQLSLAFRFSLQPMTAYRPVCRTCFMFYRMFYFTCESLLEFNAPLRSRRREQYHS